MQVCTCCRGSVDAEMGGCFPLEIVILHKQGFRIQQNNSLAFQLPLRMAVLKSSRLEKVDRWKTDL